jgi:phosphoglycerol transferase MdoB-like AlkP superfamily enzyme
LTSAGSRCPSNLRPPDSELMSLHFSRHLLRRVFESSQFGALYLAAALYAIGKFLEEIKTKPYFDDTMIIILGDHGAPVYGKENILLRTYELPLLFYSPKHFKPREVDILTSQIDVASTVLGMFNISYDSVFSGKDVFKCDPKDRFVLLNHNRDIALYDGSKLTELNFRKTGNTYLYDKPGNRQTKIKRDEEQVKNAASIYQSAYTFYLDKLYRWH